MQVLKSGRANALLLVALLVAQLLLMAASVKRAEGATLLQSGVGAASRPVVGVARRVAEAIRAVGSLAGELWTARKENARLQHEVRDLRAQLEGLREQGYENRRLRRLLGMREDLAPRSVAASVVTSQFSDQIRVIVLDRGTRSGVAADQPVVAFGGAVGRVVWAGGEVSKVRVLTDPSSGIAGVVQRSRVEGMVFGRGDGPLDMAYVPRHADVVLGDRVVTSGKDGVFPRGFGIGTVIAVGDPIGVSRAIRIEPEVAFDSLEEVLVLVERVGSDLLEEPAPAETAP